MAATTPTQGFFSSTGVLDTDAVRSPSASSAKSTSASDADLKKQAADEAAAAISDAAVTKISSQLDVGSTGYDKGVADVVKAAISSGLQKRQSDSPAPSARREIGGTYQNEIIAKAKADAAKLPSASPPPASQPSTPPSTPSTGPIASPPTGSIPPNEKPSKIERRQERAEQRAERKAERRAARSGEGDAGDGIATIQPTGRRKKLKNVDTEA